MRHRFMYPLLLAAALAMAMASCTASFDPGAAVTQTQKQIDTARQQVAQLPADDPGRVKLEALIAGAEKTLAAYKANLEALSKASGGADDVGVSVGAGVATVAPFLPPPANAIALILAGLAPGIYGWLRAESQKKVLRANANQAKTDGQSIAKGIAALHDINGGANLNDPASRAVMSAVMTDGAKALVKASGAEVKRVSKPLAATVAPGV